MVLAWTLNSIYKHERSNKTSWCLPELICFSSISKKVVNDKWIQIIILSIQGGILGLCMGFSLISAAEIVYHCFGGIFKGSHSSKTKRKGKIKN